MLQPQSTAFFLLLLVAFAALICWLVLTRHLVIRVLAACLAFIPALVFGIAAVNKYYDYYQNWTSAIADFTAQGGPGGAAPALAVGRAEAGISELLGSDVYTGLARAHGFTLQLTVRGRRSKLTRTVYVYLPPQYFQPRYRRYRFPAIELIHGYPGAPQDWITLLDVTTTLARLVDRGLARPAVLVMPDANGARGVSLQCLNQVGGPQDATFLATDLPDFIGHVLRVWSPGRTWGIAGYSEGGFCAANLGLQYGSAFGLAGVLSGYFQPANNQAGRPPRSVNPFGPDKRLRLRNTPTRELLNLRPGALIPQFWIGSGTDPADVRAAAMFKQLLAVRQPAVQLRLIAGGGHSMSTWRALISPMLEWMTSRLATNVLLNEARNRRLGHHAVAR
jgi:enterochelin esterase-like enzyme